MSMSVSEPLQIGHCDVYRGYYSVTITRCGFSDFSIDNIFASQHTPRYEHVYGKNSEIELKLTVDSSKTNEIPVLFHKLEKFLQDNGFIRG